MLKAQITDAITKIGVSEKVRLIQERIKKLKESLQSIKNRKEQN